MPFIDGKYVSPSLGDLPTNSSPNTNSWDLQSQLYASTNFNMTNNPEPFQGGFAKDYEDYFPTGWSKYTNVDELRALRQSTLEKWRNAAGKFIVTAGTTALDGTIGTVIGLGNMAMGGEDGQSSTDDFWNNPFSQEMNKWQADSERLMPNFKSQAEKELSAFGSLGTANFWADTVMKNAGFAVGAIATGAGWANLAKTGAKRLFPAFGKIVAQDVANAARIASGEITGAELAQSVISSAKATKYANFAQQAFGAFMGSLGESRFEAIGAAEGLKSQLQNTGQWDKLTDEEREEAIKSTGNAVFASNMALLSVSNFIQFKNIFSKPLEFNRLKSNLIRQGSTVAAKKISPYKYAAGILGRNMATEGLFEEGGQYAIEKGVTHFNAQKAGDKESNKELANILNSTMYGLEQAYTTKGGWEAILSGSIIGGLMSNISPVTTKDGKVKLTAPGQGFRKDLADARVTNALSEAGATNVNDANTRLTSKLKQIYGETSEQVKQLQAIYSNNPSKEYSEEDVQKIKDLRDGIVRSLTFAREKVKALESGDVFGYKTQEDAEFANDIFTLIKNDRLEDFFNTLDNTANYSGEELRKIYAEDSSKIGVNVDPNKIKSSDEIAKEHRERTAKIKQNAKRVADIYNAIGVKTNGVLKSAAHYELTSMMYLSEKLDGRQDSIIKSLESNLKTNNRFNFEDLSPEDRETITRVLKVTKKDTGLKTDNEFLQEAIDRAELDSSVRTLLEDLNSLNKNKREKAKEKLSDILSLKNAEDILGINAGEKSTKELIQELKDVTRIASLKDNTAKSIKMAVEDPEAFNQLVDKNIINGLDDSFFEEQLPVYKRYKETVVALEQIEEDLQRAIEQETKGDELNSESTMGNQEEIDWELMKARILEGIFEPNAKTMWRGWQTFIKSIASHQSIVEGDKGFRWFTFLEKIRSKEIGRDDVDFIIANVDSIPENLKSVVEPFYEDKIVAKGEDIKIIVVNKDGSPYLIDGKSVESNLGLPTQYHTNIATERFSMKEFEQDTIAANPNISRSELEAIIQDQWDQGIAKYKEFRESVKQSAKKVKISSYNPGTANIANDSLYELKNVLGSVVPADSNLEDLLNSIYVETFKSTNELFVEREINGRKYKLVPGFAYLEANDQLYPLEHNLLREEDINNILDIVKYLAKNKTNSDDIIKIKSFLQSLVNTYYSNKNSGGLFQFWIDTTLEDKEFKGIVFGNNRLSAADILNGNLEELKTFLGTKKYNVSKKHLAQTNYEHLRVVNGKLITTPTNYLKFLLDERIQVSEPREEDYKNILNPPKWNPSLNFTEGISLEEENPNITTASASLFGLFDDSVLIQNLQEIINNKGGKLIIAKEGKEVEFETLDISIDNNEAQVVFIKKKGRDKNKGIGYDIYLELGKRLAESGIVLQTYGQAQLGPGRNIWSKLVKEGYARKLGTNHYEFITGLNRELPALDEAPAIVQPSTQDIVEETLNLTENNNITPEDTKETDINNEESPFRVSRQTFEPVSPSEKFWFRDAFQNAVIIPVTGMIERTAVAQIINGTTIMLSSLADKGTLFHEGYHLAVNNITNAQERKAIFDDVRNRLGNKEVVTQEGNQLITVVGKNMTDNQADEWLAEEFASYMSDTKSYSFPSNKQKSLFEKVLDLINKFLNYFKISKVQDMTMKQLFDTIAKAKALRLKSEFNYRQAAYKVGSFTETQTNEILQAFNSIFFSVAFGKRDEKNNIQWLTIDPEKIFKSEQEGIYFDKVYESMKNWMSNNPSNPLFKKILDNYFDFKKLHTQLIKSYGIEELDELTEEEEKLSTGLRKEGEEANKKSVLTDIPNGIRLLVAALPNVTMNNGKLEYKKTGDFKTTSNVEYEKTLNYLHSLLAGAGSLSAMVQRLESVKNSKPYVQVLLDALDFNTEADTQARLDLRLQFHKQFNKSFLRTVKVVVSGNDITVESALEDSLIARVKQIWLGNTINLSGNGVVDIDIRNGELIIIKEKAKDWVNAASIKEALDYLALMGITFSKTPGGSLRESQEFLNAAKYIFKRIADSKYNPTVNSLFFRENEGFENTAIKRLILEESKNLDEDIELTVRTPKGETEYSITLPNNLYNLLSELQKGNTPNHLIPFKDGTGNPLTRGSKLLENKTKVSTQILRGIISAEEGFNTSEATYVDFLSSVVNSVLTGSSPLIQTADGNLVYTISGLFVNNPSSSLFNSNMRQYLKNELLATMLLELKGVGSDLKNYKDKAKSLRIFDFLPAATQTNLLKEVKDHLLEKGWNDGNIDILVDDFVDTNKGSMPLVSSSIDAFYTNLKSQAKNLLLENQLIQPIEGEEGKFTLTGISPNIVTADYSVGLTERYYEVKDTDEEGGEIIYRYNYVNDADINKIAEVIAYNDIISRIEQVNNLFGDLAFYKNPTDVAKRTKLFVSTRENSYNENSFSKEADKFYPRTDGNRRQIHYLKKVIGKSVVTNSSVADAYPSSIKDSYKEINTTDGGSIMTPDGIRDYSLRNGIWDQGQEITFQHIMQGYWRDRKISDEEFKAKFKNHLPENPEAGKTYFKGEEINLNSAKSIMPKKPQGVGPVLDVNGNAYKGLYVPQSDKTAFHIMNWEEMPKDSAVRQLLDWMVDNQVDLFEFDDANKMSMRDITPILKLENGKEVFTAPKENEITYNNWTDIGEQVRNVGERKSKITVSTQMLRLTPANFVPSIEEYYRGDQEKIDATVELFKQKADEYNKAISDLVTKKKETLYEELGAVKIGDTWLIGQDKIEEFKSRLIKILKNKSVADNEIKGVELAFEKVQKFDILLNKSKIEQVLNSMFKNDVISGKVKGEALVQQSSFGYNANLKSYTESKTGTNIMEVMIPIPRDLYKWAISKYGTLENFNNNLDKIDQRLIEIPANRIPCQGLNLIDVVKVKRFLPPYAGNRILVPYDFTKKTGSDFDFDKLNTYYNNFYIKNGDIKYLEYITEKNDVAYNQWLDLIAEDEIDGLKAKDVHLRRFISRLNNVQEEIRNASEFMSKSVQDTYFKYITETTGVIPNDWTEALQALKDFRQERILKIEQINSYLGENYVENPEEDVLRAKGKKYLPDFKEKETERKELAKEVRTISESLNNIYETLKAVRERQITNEDQIESAAKAVLTRKENILKQAFDNTPIDQLNSKKSLENKVNELIKWFITRPENFVSLMTPTDQHTEILDNFIQKQYGDPVSPKYSDIVKLKYNIDLAKEFWVGKKGVGSTAIAQVNHAFTQLYPIKISSPFVRQMFYNDSKNDTPYYLGHYEDNKGNSIQNLFNGFLSLYVDVAKDPKIKKINIYEETFSVFNFLVRTAKSNTRPANFNHIATFLNQPVIKDYLSRVSNLDSQILSIRGKNPSRNEVLNELFSSLNYQGIPLFKLYKDAMKGDMSSKEELTKRLAAEEIMDMTYLSEKPDQARVLDHYLLYLEYGKELDQLQLVLRPDSGFPKSRAGNKAYFTSLRDMETSSIFDMGDVYKFLNDSYLKPYYDVRKESLDIFSKFFMTDSLEIKAPFEDMVARMTGNGNEDKVNIMEDYFISFILQKVLNRNGNSLYSEATNMFKSGKDNKTVSESWAELREKMPNNVIVKELFSVKNKFLVSRKKGLGLDTVKLFNKKMSAHKQDLLANAFREIYDSNPELGKDLIYLSIMRSGNRYTPDSYQAILPNDVYVKLIEEPIQNFFNSLTFEKGKATVEEFENIFRANLVYDKGFITKVNSLLKNGKPRYLLTKRAKGLKALPEFQELLSTYGEDAKFMFLNNNEEFVGVNLRYTDNYGTPFEREANRPVLLYNTGVTESKEVEGKVYTSTVYVELPVLGIHNELFEVVKDGSSPFYLKSNFNTNVEVLSPLTESTSLETNDPVSDVIDDPTIFPNKATDSNASNVNALVSTGRTSFTTKEALTILKNNAKSEPMRILADHLMGNIVNEVPIEVLDYGDLQELHSAASEKYEFEVTGVYDLDINKIFVANNSKDSTVLHEIIHVFTVAKLRTPTIPGVQDLKNIYEHVKIVHPELKSMYSMSNLDEFMTGIFTNAEFMRKLQTLPSRGTGKLTLWDNLITALSKLFGFSKDQKNLLTEAMDIGTRILSDKSKAAPVKEKSSIFASAMSKLEMMDDKMEAYRQQEITKKKMSKAKKAQKAVNEVSKESPKNTLNEAKKFAVQEFDRIFPQYKYMSLEEKKQLMDWTFEGDLNLNCKV